MTARAVVCTLAALCGVARGSTYRFKSLRTSIEHGDYVYRFVRRGRVKDFILETTVRTTDEGPAVRIVFGYQDERNHYYAEAADTGCLFVKVEDGIEKRIGTQSAGQLPRGAALEVALVRWRHTMGLWLDGREAIEAYDGGFPAGRVGLGGRKDTVAIDTVTFQATGDVRLRDDFMRTDAEQNTWETVAGSWKLRSLPNAGLSANAFQFAGQADGKPALAVRGNWFWHDYVASAACRPLEEKAVGLVFYYRSPTRYHLLRWQHRAQGGLEVVRVADGRREVLGRAGTGFVTGQWYELAVRVVGRRATAFVDGNPLVDVTDAHLASGRIGLYAEGNDGALFDDVAVVAPRDFEESFERETAGKWLELGGTWRRRPGPLDGEPGRGHCLVASAEGEGRYVSGEEDWSDYTVAADFLPPARGHVGLVAHYQDEANYYLLAFSQEAVSLVKMDEGERKVLAERPHRVPLGAVRRMALSVKDGVLTGRLGGQALVRRCDRTLDHGRAGLYIRQGGTGFDSIAVTFPRRAQPIFTTHEVFQAEESMENWAVRQSDWLEVGDELGGKRRDIRWHRADFPGDIELEANIEKLPDGGRLWLVLGGDGHRVASGYAVSLERKGDACRVAAERQGKRLAQERVSLKRPPKLFGAERVGHAILAHLDGQVVLTCEDPQPLAGCRIAWAAAGARLEKDGVDTYSRHVTVYAFHKAPVDWRRLAGEWEVTNRWACDPRWSFFCGERKGDPLVAMWNKRDFGPDVTLEFAAGIRHDPNRGGSKYRYASDINAVLCGDGRDLRHGYNFVFGGWGNEATRILRNGQVLGETKRARFPRDYSIHRRWFYFKMQKQGRRLRLYVDNELALECADPDPLTGSKVALWTWNNDLMVARVRISAEGEAPCELPVGPPPPQPRCCYR